MSRFYQLVLFILKNYKRASNLILEALLTAIVAGLIFDPRWKPYTDQYVIMGKSIFLMVLGTAISYRLSRVNYTGQISMLLSRVSRKTYYLASGVSSILVAVLFSAILDAYLMLVVDVRPTLLVGVPMLLSSFFNLVLSVAIIHIFSIYIIKDQMVRLLGPVVLSLGALPGWYSGLPLEQVFHFLAYLLPPLHANLTGLMNGQVSFLSYLYLGLYSIFSIALGMYLFERRSLTNLQR